MIQALRIAATGMTAQQTNVDVLSNNIANLNTTAFKSQVAAFTDLMYQSKVGVGAITSSVGTVAPTGTQVGLGAQIASVYSVNTQGPISQTDNTLDMAIQGRGYFKITGADGTTRFTRDGTFSLDSNGQVVNKDGFSLDPNITIPNNAVDVTIADTGEVTGNVAGTVTQFGTITLAMFTNEGGLRNVGNNLYEETEASGTATDVNPGSDGSGGVLQGFLEASNVDAITAVSDLITAQRAYELNSRVISTADEMLGAVNQIS